MASRLYSVQSVTLITVVWLAVCQQFCSDKTSDFPTCMKYVSRSPSHAAMLGEQIRLKVLALVHCKVGASVQKAPAPLAAAQPAEHHADHTTQRCNDNASQQ